jgi:ABC-type dipeptide/oligopeptide/nickel transport system permease component
MIPVITVLGLPPGALLVAPRFEKIFSWPGIGRLTIAPSLNATTTSCRDASASA